jgi:hypothetical protein
MTLTKRLRLKGSQVAREFKPNFISERRAGHNPTATLCSKYVTLVMTWRIRLPAVLIIIRGWCANKNTHFYSVLILMLLRISIIKVRCVSAWPASWHELASATNSYQINITIVMTLV